MLDALRLAAELLEEAAGRAMLLEVSERIASALEIIEGVEARAREIATAIA